jgi:putative redox protein
MRSEKFEFQGHDGSTLAGRLDRPVEPPLAVAIFAHCFTCSKDFLASRRIAQRLAGRGVAVLRFDFTGLGHSQGEFANSNFSSNVEDLLSAAQALESSIGAPSLLIGHSLGGAAVVAAASKLSSVKAVATIGAPADPAHVAHNFGGALAQIAQDGEAEVDLAGRKFTIKKQFLDDIEATRLDDILPKLKAALLVMHAPRDATVGVENASRLFSGARHPKSFISLDDADHLLTRQEDADYAANIIADWSARYLSLRKVALPQPESGVRAFERDPTGYLNRILAARDRLVFADEPKKVGGTDLGFSPFELVAAGLAACTTMTMRMYAKRKGWEMDGAQVDVTWSQTDRYNSTFRREISLDPSLTEDQRTRMIEIADKCPVHRMLEGHIDVETVGRG